MNLLNFLNAIRSEIPLIQKNADESFLIFLEKYFKAICFKLESIDFYQIESLASSFGWSGLQLCHNFDYLTRMIVKTIQIMNDGRPSLAYGHFKNKIMNIDFDQSNTNYLNYLSTFGSGNACFYRIRKKDTNNQIFDIDDLFHIPFQLRTEVKPQRFSILGHPSLYLGTSIFNCWLEMGQPNIADIYVCKFELDKAAFFAELCVPNEFTGLSTKEEREKAFRFLISFPLIAASLVKVKKPESPFKPEYIIPQLLLQYIRNDKNIHGIMYTSTKVSNRNYNDAWNFRNVVIPVFSNKETGYCEKLRKMFIVSKPVLFDDTLLLNPTDKFLFMK